MNIRSRMSVIALTAISVAGIAAPALAHVTVNPRQAPKGGFAELVFRAPNEQDDADTTKVQVFFPIDHPIAFVSVHPTPGWDTTVSKKKLAKPIKSDDGEVTEAVSSITWTGELKPGEYEDLAVSVGPLPDDTDQLVFKAIQTYSNGDVVRWIEVPSGGAEAEHPAPILTLTDAANEPKATESATPSPTTTPAPTGTTATSNTSGSDGTARGLGIAGLVLGAVALLVAVSRGRRRTG